MTPEWVLVLLNDPQGFWALLQYYSTVPFTGGHVETSFLSKIRTFLVNNPFDFFAVVMLALLCGSLLAGRIVMACDSRSKKKEQQKR